MSFNLPWLWLSSKEFKNESDLLAYKEKQDNTIVGRILKHKSKTSIPTQLQANFTTTFTNSLYQSKFLFVKDVTYYSVNGEIMTLTDKQKNELRSNRIEFTEIDKSYKLQVYDTASNTLKRVIMNEWIDGIRNELTTRKGNDNVYDINKIEGLINEYYIVFWLVILEYF
jgi:hypothetical protein